MTTGQITITPNEEAVLLDVTVWNPGREPRTYEAVSSATIQRLNELAKCWHVDVDLDAERGQVHVHLQQPAEQRG